MVFAFAGKKKEKAVLQALQGALAGNKEQVTGSPEVHLTLFWNTRNAAYLLRALERGGASKAQADLLLQVGPGPGFHSSTDSKPEDAKAIKTIQWGWRADGADLFIPLDRSILLSGYSEPSGRSPRRAGKPSQEAIKKLIIG
jgi:hypothetical protein